MLDRAVAAGAADGRKVKLEHRTRTASVGWRSARPPPPNERLDDAVAGELTR
jgi:hypothetical protein